MRDRPSGNANKMSDGATSVVKVDKSPNDLASETSFTQVSKIRGNLLQAKQLIDDAKQMISVEIDKTVTDNNDKQFLYLKANYDIIVVNIKLESAVEHIMTVEAHGGK